jgi:exocyst complex component 1
VRAPQRGINDVPRSGSPAPVSSVRPPRPTAGPSRSRPASPPNETPPPAISSIPDRSIAPSPAGSHTSAAARARRPRGFSNAQAQQINRGASATSQGPVPSINAPISPAPIRPIAVSSVQSRASAYDTPQSSQNSLDPPQPAQSSASLAAPSPSDYDPNMTRPRSTSPAPSARSVRSRQASTYSRADGAEGVSTRPDPRARISFFDPGNKATLDRLVARNFGDIAAEDDEIVGAEEEGTAQVTLATVEEMLEGYEWIGEGLGDRRARGSAEQIESRLLDELTALDKVSGILHISEQTNDNFVGKHLFLFGV